jgi:hypothetical protein
VVTSTSKAEYMALTLATKKWIWLMNALEEPNVPVTNPVIFCNNKTTIDIVYNHKIGDQSKHIDVFYHLVRDNVESGWISLFQVELGENLNNVYTNRLPQVTIWKLQTAIMDAKCIGFWRIFSYIVIYCGFSFYMS